MGLGAGGGMGGAAGGQQLDIEALRNNPHIRQLREQILADPSSIQPLIQNLAQQNPAIAQMLAQNPELLMHLLGLEDDGEGGVVPPGAQVISVTEEEMAAIQRLESLGFSRRAASEAFFACDKNEELAANYLFETQFQDE